MKIKSNVRAGGGSSSANSNAKVGGHSSQAAGTIGFYLPPISRCVGL
jgi:hypothetical protein